MEKPVETGGTTRAHLESLAKRIPKYRKKLEAPAYPAWIGYMRQWSRELHGRSGAGMSGLLPVSYQTIGEWSRLKRIRLMPYEVDGLIAVDMAMLYPGDRDG